MNEKQDKPIKTSTYKYAVRGYKLFWKEETTNYMKAHKKFEALKNDKPLIYWKLISINDETKEEQEVK